MTWYKNYLAAETQPWARQVQKEVDNLKANFRTAEVNNTTRDDQLASSFRQVAAATLQATQAATDAAQAALDASAANALAITANGNALDALQDVIDLSSPGGPTISASNITVGTLDASDITVINLSASSINTGSLNADFISGGTIDASDIFGVNITGTSISGGTISGTQVTGSTFSTSGTRRVELTGTNANFYDGNGTLTGRVTAGEDGRAATLYIGSNVSGVFMYNGGMDLEANGQVTVTGGNGFHSAGPISTSSNLTVTGTLSAGTFSPSSLSTGAITATSLNIGTSEVGTNYIYAQSVTGDSVGGGNASFTGSVEGQSSVVSGGTLTRTLLVGGGTTGASITDGGNFVRTSSSQRYKTDIQLLDINLNDLYDIEPKTFKRIEEVEEHGESAKTYPGFIAEELAGTSLDKFVFYSKDENGNERPEGIHYPELTAALLLALKDLNARIATLEAKV